MWPVRDDPAKAKAESKPFPVFLFSSFKFLSPKFQSGGRMKSIWRAILTDSQFWVPAAVLAFGIALLTFLH